VGRSDIQFGMVLRATDGASATLDRVGKNVDALVEPARRAGRAFDSVATPKFMRDLDQMHAKMERARVTLAEVKAAESARAGEFVKSFQGPAALPAFMQDVEAQRAARATLAEKSAGRRNADANGAFAGIGRDEVRAASFEKAMQKPSVPAWMQGIDRQQEARVRAAEMSAARVKAAADSAFAEIGKAAAEASKSGAERLNDALTRTNARIEALVAPARRAGQAFSDVGMGLGLDKVAGSAQAIGQHFGVAVDRVRGFAFAGAAAGVGLGWLFKREFVDPGIKFNNWKDSLEAIEGSAQKAASGLRSMEELSFKLPVPLEQLTGAYVDLRVRGLHPTEAMMTSLSDASIATGRDVSELAGVLGIAAKGRVERLEDLGIKVDTHDDLARLKWIDQKGKEQTRIINRNKRDQVAAAFMDWTGQYKGKAAENANDLDGLMSRIGNRWTAFKNQINKSTMPKLESAFGGVLTKIEGLAASGALEKLADKIGGKFAAGIDMIIEKGPGFIESIEKAVGWIDKAVDSVGGFGNALLLIGGAKLAPTALEIGRLGMSVGGLAKDLVLSAARLGMLGGELARVARLGNVAKVGLDGLPASAGSSLGQTTKAFGAAGAVIGAAMAGWGLGTILDEQITKALGKSLGERVYEWLGNDTVDKQEQDVAQRRQAALTKEAIREQDAQKARAARLEALRTGGTPAASLDIGLDESTRTKRVGLRPARALDIGLDEGGARQANDELPLAPIRSTLKPMRAQQARTELGRGEVVLRFEGQPPPGLRVKRIAEDGLGIDVHAGPAMVAP
jgi:hypothetical protein